VFEKKLDLFQTFTGIFKIPSFSHRDSMLGKEEKKCVKNAL